MTTIYDAMILKHRTHAEQEPKAIVFFYDEDRKEVLKQIQKYVKQNGFTYTEHGNRYSCMSVALRERESTGKLISLKMYHELFDTITGEAL